MSELESEYRLEYFETEGFHRKQCPVPDVYFCTREPDRGTCGDPHANDYPFIDNPGFSDQVLL